MHLKSNNRRNLAEDALQSALVLIDDATVARLLTPSAVLGVIRGAFLDPPSAPPRLTVTIDDAAGQSRTLLTMPALRRRGLATVKVVSVRHGESVRLASYLLAFAQDGQLLALIEAHQLTARRTSAASVLAAQVLGAGGACRLAVLGAGRQARAQLEGFADAMPLLSIALWARRCEAAEELAEFARQFEVPVRIATTPGDAVRGADLITCATGSRVPLVLAADVAAGAHVDLVGGFRPDMREADDALIARATVIADIETAFVEAGDLAAPIGRGAIKLEDIQLLGTVLAGEKLVIRGDVTLFKSVGHAAEDLVVTELLLQLVERERLHCTGPSCELAHG